MHRLYCVFKGSISVHSYCLWSCLGKISQSLSRSPFFSHCCIMVSRKIRPTLFIMNRVINEVSPWLSLPSPLLHIVMAISPWEYHTLWFKCLVLITLYFFLTMEAVYLVFSPYLSMQTQGAPSQVSRIGPYDLVIIPIYWFYVSSIYNLSHNLLE